MPRPEVLDAGLRPDGAYSRNVARLARLTVASGWSEPRSVDFPTCRGPSRSTEWRSCFSRDAISLSYTWVKYRLFYLRSTALRIRLALDQHTAVNQVVADLEAHRLHVERFTVLNKLQ